MLLEATDFGVALLDLGEPDFSLCAEPTLERREPDRAGDRLSDLRLPSTLFDSTVWLLDREDLPLAFDAGERAPFSSSEFGSLLARLGVSAGACDAGLPLRLDLEDAEALSDSEPENEAANEFKVHRLRLILT